MKLKFFFLLLLSLYIVNSTLYITHATVRFVSKSGTSTPPYTSWQTAADSIQKCINISFDGDTIYVANGVYKENLVINTTVNLIGSCMDSTVIDGSGLGDMSIVINSNGLIKNFFLYGKENNTWTNGIIWAFTQNTVIKVEYCKFTNTGWGISCVNSTLKANNLVMNNVRGGLAIGGTIPLNFEIDNCLINSIKGIGTGFASESIFDIKNNIILYSGTDNPESGISLGAVKKVYIKNNLISGFMDNIFFDTVIDTAFVINNIFTYQSGSGASASIWSSGNGVFANNLIFKNNNKGIYQSGSGYVRSNFNVFWNNVIDLVGLISGDSDFVADPMFVKDTIPTANGNYDFHLQAFSPAIDKGDPNIFDVDSTRSDIGMYGGPFGETYTYQDLAPLAPRNLSALVDTHSILVKWNRNTEADTAYYKVYKDTVINFTIDSTKLISSPTDTFFIQLPPYNSSKYVYKITCVDNQGNESLPSAELVVNITSVSTNDYPITISDYILYQNYPNPFNPSTKIGYQLKERAYVKLMVYDIKGELITVLVNKEQNAGYYEIEFSSSSIQNPESSIKGLASGIYLYRIEVIGEGNIPVYTEMKKMLMIK